MREYAKYGCLVILLCGLLPMQQVQSQVLDVEEELFAFEVKQLDEFFERFNNQETLVTKYVAEANPDVQFSREILLKSLFDLRSTQMTQDLALDFIKTISDPKNPIFLNFSDKDWYAAVKCSILHDDKQQNVLLILNIQTEADGALKWVITSVKADFLEPEQQKNPKVSLNPVSHGTEFLGLSKALADRENVRNYLPDNFRSNALSVFVHEWQHNRIVFQQVTSITYHFLQVEGWIMTLDDFKRQSKNSGWLISNLIKVDVSGKSDYRKRILNIDL